MNPNPEQLEAVEAREGYVQLLAGPGSGKTSVIVARYKQLIKTTPPEQVLSLTFTAESAKEMRKRAGDPERDPAGRPHGFMTFHSLALTFAQQEREQFPFKLADFPLATEDALYALEAIKKYRCKYKVLRSQISYFKRNGISPITALQKAESQEEIHVAQAYRHYDFLCRDNGVLDFDSLLVEMVNVLRTKKEVLQQWQYEYIQVDEGQDADSLQWSLVQLLSHQHKNVFAVGDGGQAIYAWRGAEPDLFLEFNKMFPGARTLYLAKNHRSTGEIVGFVKQIGPVKELAEKFWTENELGEKPIIMHYPNYWMEAADIVNQIADHPVETAIIARTNRALQIYQELLYGKKIKYFILGKNGGFWKQSEIKSILTRLQNPEQRLLYQPAAASVERIISDTHARERYADYTELDNNPLENLREMLRIAQKYDTTKDFLDHVRKVINAARKAKGAVALSTVHQAKGCEFNTVYVIDVSEGSMPHKNGDPLEEERIFFVAASRAAKQLHLSYSGPASRFIAPFIGKQTAIEDWF